MDKRSIILMAKLASYDKYVAPADKKRAEYFRHDYIYRRNLGVRLYALIGSLIVVVFYFMHRLVLGGLDPMDLTGEVLIDLLKCGIFIVAVQVLFTMIGFFIYSREYNDARGRIDEYYDNMRKLSKRKRALEERDEKSTRRREGLTNGYGANYGEFTES